MATASRPADCAIAGVTVVDAFASTSTSRARARHDEVDFEPLLIAKIVELDAFAAIHLLVRELGSHEPFEECAEER